MFGYVDRFPDTKETVNREGWFYDLGDLNQSVPFVRQNLLDWVRYMAPWP